jgi:hypothetical protein
MYPIINHAHVMYTHAQIVINTAVKSSVFAFLLLCTFAKAVRVRI